MPPPVETRRIEHLIYSLQDAYQWDPVRGAYRTQAYTMLLKSGEEAIEPLARAITDETTTQIMDRYPDRVPVIGDMAFLILIKITGRDPAEFRDIGVRMTGDPNPIFALEFSLGARARARDRFLEGKD
jgi:hypothetical protein